MATKQPPSSVTKQRANYTRLCRLITEVGTRVLREIFDSLHPPDDLQKYINSSWVWSELKILRAKRVLSTWQWTKLYPASGVPLSTTYDITLLFLLLRNICGLTKPAKGWDAAPLPSDASKEADLVRIKRCRNAITGHNTEAALSDGEFEDHWVELEAALIRLGGLRYQPEIQRLKIESMDPENEAYLNVLLQKWEVGEDVKMDAISQKLDRVIKTGELSSSEITRVNNKFDQLHQGQKEIKWGQHHLQKREEKLLQGQSGLTKGQEQILQALHESNDAESSAHQEHKEMLKGVQVKADEILKKMEEKQTLSVVGDVPSVSCNIANIMVSGQAKAAIGNKSFIHGKEIIPGSEISTHLKEDGPEFTETTGNLVPGAYPSTTFPSNYPSPLPEKSIGVRDIYTVNVSGQGQAAVGHQAHISCGNRPANAASEEIPPQLDYVDNTGSSLSCKSLPATSPNPREPQELEYNSLQSDK